LVGIKLAEGFLVACIPQCFEGRTGYSWARRLDAFSWNRFQLLCNACRDEVPNLIITPNESGNRREGNMNRLCYCF